MKIKKQDRNLSPHMWFSKIEGPWISRSISNIITTKIIRSYLFVYDYQEN